MTAPRTETRYLEGDDLWLDAEPGWYWGEVDEDSDFEDLGDTWGPFATEAEAEADRVKGKP
jgi:hypothetical protein